MKKIAYRVLKRYPGLVKNIVVGDIVVKENDESFFYKLSSDEECMFVEREWIPAKNLEEQSEFFEKIEIEIIIK